MLLQTCQRRALSVTCAPSQHVGARQPLPHGPQSAAQSAQGTEKDRKRRRQDEGGGGPGGAAKVQRTAPGPVTSGFAGYIPARVVAEEENQVSTLELLCGLLSFCDWAGLCLAHVLVLLSHPFQPLKTDMALQSALLRQK